MPSRRGADLDVEGQPGGDHDGRDHLAAGDAPSGPERRERQREQQPAAEQRADDEHRPEAERGGLEAVRREVDRDPASHNGRCASATMSRGDSDSSGGCCAATRCCTTDAVA